MQEINSQAKQSLLTRLRRIEGQLRGVQGMVEQSRDCREVLQQLTAIRSAVHGATVLLLQEYASQCLLSAEEQPREERRQLIQDLMALLSKAP